MLKLFLIVESFKNWLHFIYLLSSLSVSTENHSNVAQKKSLYTDTNTDKYKIRCSYGEPNCFYFQDF